MHLQRGVQPALAGAHRRLGLDEHQGHAVDQQHQVGALLGLAGAHGELLGEDKAVFLDLVEIDQADGDVFAIRAEGHRAFAEKPGDKLLVRLHQPVLPRAQDDGTQAVEHVVCPTRVCRDLGVEADQGVAQVGLNQHLLRLTRKAGGGKIVPAKARDLAARASEADCHLRRASRGRAREKVTQMGFNGVGFGEGHSLTSVSAKTPSRILVWASCAFRSLSAASDTALAKSETRPQIVFCSSSDGTGTGIGLRCL